MAQDQDSFPWEAGIFDAHCHPTDMMSSISNISTTMQARTLTVMSTRSQDQHLVEDVAKQFSLRSREAMRSTNPGCEKAIPAFGFHPWFTHEFYDDSANVEDSTYDPNGDPVKEKSRHYGAVLTPSPAEDADFLSALPKPQPLSAFLAKTRDRLKAYPLALVGEIGLDRAFRLPQPWTESEKAARDESLTLGGRESRKLSPYRVSPNHQTRILKAQLVLAGEMDRAVSIHGVQAHQALLEALKSSWKGHEKEVLSKTQQRRNTRVRDAKGVNFEDSSDEESVDGKTNEKKLENNDRSAAEDGPQANKPYPPRICLHSFSGNVDVMRSYTNDKSIPAKIFFSFSYFVNVGVAKREELFRQVVRACPDDRILIESDLHFAGKEMDDSLEKMYRTVCVMKAWNLKDGVERIRKNYEEFIFG